MSPHAWQKQEVFKGTLYCDWLGTWGATQNAGWGLKSSWVEDPPGSDDWQLTPDYTPAAAAAVAAGDPTQFTTNPVFRHTPEWLVGTSVLTQPQQNEMLAKGIPALTPAAGNTAMTEFAGMPGSPNQFDLNAAVTAPVHFRPNGWPRPPDSEPFGDWWLHNDFREVAYLYTQALFQHIVLLGELK
jgi:hypothetical protein